VFFSLKSTIRERCFLF